MPTKQPCVAGSNILTSRKVMQRLVGDEVFDRALTTFTKDEREAYLESTMLTWVPVVVADAAITKVANAALTTPEALIVEVTRIAQEEMLNTIFRMLMRITTDEALIGRTNSFYTRVYDTGALSSVFPEPGRANVSLTGWPSISTIQIAGLGAGIETTLRCAGRKDVRMQSKRAPDGASYTATWRK